MTCTVRGRRDEWTEDKTQNIGWFFICKPSVSYCENASFGLILTRYSGFQALKAKTILREGKLSIKGIIYRFKTTSSLVFFFPISRVFGTILCWVLRSKARDFLCLVVVPLCVLTQCRSVELHMAIFFGEVKRKGELYVCLISAGFPRSLCVFWYQNCYL